MLKYASLTTAALVLSYRAPAQTVSTRLNTTGSGCILAVRLATAWVARKTYFNNCNDGKPCGAFPDGDHPWTSNDPSGALAGLTLGYNYRLNERWLAGVEGDISLADITGKDNMYWGDGHKLAHWLGRSAHPAGPRRL